MKTDYRVSKALEDVWEMKRLAYEETKGLAIKDYFKHVGNTVKFIVCELKKNTVTP